MNAILFKNTLKFGQELAEFLKVLVDSQDHCKKDKDWECMPHHPFMVTDKSY